MRLLDEKLIYGSKLSDHIYKTPEGFVVCYAAVLARTGSYKYLESEIIENGDPNKVVYVYRTPEEVFKPSAIASFENKPLCDAHPDVDVTMDNYRDLSKGFLRNVRRGDGDFQDCLVGDIVITDPEVAEDVLHGTKRELSLGYNTNIIQDASGKYLMTDIIGNHVALVESGRAGCATIRDANSLDIGEGVMSKKYYRITDEGIDEINPTEEEIMTDEDIVEVEAEEEELPEPAIEDDDVVELGRDDPNLEDDDSMCEPIQDEGSEKLDTIISLLQQLLEALSPKAVPVEAPAPELIPETPQEDAEPVPEEKSVDDIPVEEEEEGSEAKEIVVDEDETTEQFGVIDADEIPEDKMDPSKIDDAAVATYKKFAGSAKDSAEKVDKVDIFSTFAKRYQDAMN